MIRLLDACVVALAVWTAGAPAGQRPVLEDAVVRESDAGAAPQVSTAELRDLLARDEAVALDARPPEEYAVSHIPGALNVAQKPGTSSALYISDVGEVKRLVPDKERTLVVYCNGPFCGKSRRLAEELVAAGYRRVRRYQLGMPGWRAAGGTARIEAAAIRHVERLDRTAVFVDAGADAPLSVSGARRITLDQVVQAKEDGRLPMTDHNTRIIVIGRDGAQAQARAVAEQIAANAFHNVAFFDSTGAALDQTR